MKSNDQRKRISDQDLFSFVEKQILLNGKSDLLPFLYQAKEQFIAKKKMGIKLRRLVLEILAAALASDAYS